MSHAAIVVGIGSYPRFGADGQSSNDLAGAVEDAKAVAAWLADEAGATVKLITSAGLDGQPWTSTEIRPHIADVNGGFVPYATHAGRVADRLTVYMAGHGIAPTSLSRCLILADAVGVNWVPNLEAPAWIEWLANQTQFDELVLWMDCCGTQALEYSRGLPGLPNVLSRPPPPANVFMAFGSGAGRAAYEGPIGPGGAIRGLFTDQLLRGLSGAAADPSGEVRSESLASYLRNGASAARMGGEVRKTEVQPAEVPRRDDMLFATKPPPTYRIRVADARGDALPDGTVVTLTSPRGPYVAVAPVRGGRVSFALGVGIYKLAAQGYGRLLEIGATTPPDID